MLLYGKPVQFDAEQEIPEGWGAVGHAAAAAAMMTFSLTHNPLFHMLVFPAVITTITGPFWGGMMAAGKAKLNPLGAVLCALAVSAADAGFFGFIWFCAWAILESYPYIGIGSDWPGQILATLGCTTSAPFDSANQRASLMLPRFSPTASGTFTRRRTCASRS